MNKIFNFLIFCTIVNTIPTIASAQNQQGCFMVDSQGNPLDLSHLCGGSNTNSNGSNRAYTSGGRSGRFIAKIKRRESGIPVIDVKFNDKYTFEMMLDTGASLTVLTPKMANALKFRADGIIYVATPSDRQVEVLTGLLSSASVGGATSKNIRVAISSFLDMGLLGQNFFSEYDITIKEDTIEFRKR